MKKRFWLAGLTAALLVAILSPLASGHPDGLERVASDHGFSEKARDAPFEIIRDYLFPGVESGPLATIIAGVVGTVLLFLVTVGLGRLLSRRRTEG